MISVSIKFVRNRFYTYYTVSGLLQLLVRQYGGALMLDRPYLWIINLFENIASPKKGAQPTFHSDVPFHMQFFPVSHIGCHRPPQQRGRQQTPVKYQHSSILLPHFL